MNYFQFAVENMRQQFPSAKRVHVEERVPLVCCAERAAIIESDGDTDRWACPQCQRTWTAPSLEPTV